jgi:Holliday junction DNA helicase RuvA
MYSFLTGCVAKVNQHGPKGATLVLSVGGIGYLIHTTGNTLAKVTVGNEVTIHTHLVVQETVLDLVGFATVEERDLFNLLLQASGVGVRVALALMSDLSVADIVQAIITDNYKDLTAAKGVGPKLAQKLVLELREKMAAYRDNVAMVLPEDGQQPLPQSPAIEDAQSVLLSLGYGHQEIHASLQQAISADAADQPTEAVLQSALQWLAQHA